MRYYLVRHAQTTWNGENRLQGQSDRPLSEHGLHQAEQLGELFAMLKASGRPLGGLVTSHLARSRQTAEAIGRRIDLTPQVDADLAEMSLGAWEGLTAEEIDARFPQRYHQWKRSPSSVEIPEAESIPNFRQRVRAGFARLVEAHRDGECVVVTHGGVLAAWLADWLKADFDQVLQRVVLVNAGVSTIDCRRLPPCVLELNSTHHLESMTHIGSRHSDPVSDGSRP